MVKMAFSQEEEKARIHTKGAGFIIDGFTKVVFTVTITFCLSLVGFLLFRLCIVQETKMAYMSFLLPEILNRPAHYTQQPLCESSE